MILRASIDVTLIDKAKIKDATRKNGNPAKFYEMVIFIDDEENQYGQIGKIVESITLDEKNAGVKGPILGNLTPTGKKAEPAPAPKVERVVHQDSTEHDDIPF